ncbi:MAG: hypothetical protein SF172_08780 [Burkholderiales bacterium]|nr:hypothetical protein [Burkholderiales bacterium]
MHEIFFVSLIVLLLAAPGIILLVMRPEAFKGRFWLGVPVGAMLIVMFGGSMLNQLMGWSEAWGFLIVWLASCGLAWWVPTYDRNRRGRLAASKRMDAVVDDADAPAQKD